MAMNKKEIAEVDALRARLAQATALRDLTIHSPAQVPVDPSLTGASIQSGLWWANSYPLLNGFGGALGQIQSCVGSGLRKGSFSHATSVDKTRLNAVSWIQGPGQFFASRHDALLAVRDAVVVKFAAILAAIDAELAKGE